MSSKKSSISQFGDKLLLADNDYGLKEEFGKKMIINRGLGGPMKVIRLFNRPEIGIIKFIKQK